MSREIKFRAWNGKFMEDDPEIHLVDSCPLNEQIEAINKEYSLMQFTGLNDKNDMEIYEGDIVRETLINMVLIKEHGQQSETLEVGFCDGAFQLKRSNGNTHNIGSVFHDYEVIGNIHESPELLEKQDVRSSI